MLNDESDSFHDDLFVMTSSRVGELNEYKKENKELKLRISENNSLLEQFENSKKQTSEQQKEIIKKKMIIEEKKKELGELQKAYIALLEGKEREIDSLQPVSIILNRIQDFIMQLSDKAVNDERKATSVRYLLTVCRSINELYNQCVSHSIIEESFEDALIRRNSLREQETEIYEMLRRINEQNKGM